MFAALAAGELAPLLDGSAANENNPVDSSDAARFRVWDAVARALVSASDRRPLLVQLDDLHWADPSSLRLLRHVAETADRGRITVLGTRRRAPEPHGALAAVGEAFARRGALRVELAGLDTADVGTLVRHASGRLPDEAEARALRDRTEGNPFFLVELVRAGAAGDVPVAVADVVAARIAALPEETREVLRTAAVAGRRVDLALLAAVAWPVRSSGSCCRATTSSSSTGSSTWPTGPRCRWRRFCSRCSSARVRSSGPAPDTPPAACPTWLTTSRRSCSSGMVAGVAHVLGLPDRASSAYQRMAPYAGRVASGGSGAALGPVDAFLALAAATVGETDLATRHADDADELLARWEIPVAARWFRELRKEHGF